MVLTTARKDQELPLLRANPDRQNFIILQNYRPGRRANPRSISARFTIRCGHVPVTLQSCHVREKDITK